MTIWLSMIINSIILFIELILMSAIINSKDKHNWYEHRFNEIHNEDNCSTNSVLIFNTYK